MNKKHFNTLKTLQDFFNYIRLLDEKILKNKSIVNSLENDEENIDNFVETHTILQTEIINDNNKLKKLRFIMQTVNYENELLYNNKSYKIYKLINLKERLVFESKTKKESLKNLTQKNINYTKLIVCLNEDIFNLSNKIAEILKVLNNFNSNFIIDMEKYDEF